MKKLIILTLIVFLMGCAGAEFHPPRIGMTYDDWIDSCRWYEDERLVSAEGNKEIWTRETGLFYYFEGGRLVKIHQGQLMQARIGMTYDEWTENKNVSIDYSTHTKKMVGAEGNK